jgi:hypothetical protein
MKGESKSMIVQMEETAVNTDKALAHWEEATYWNGSNHISKATGSQWNHQTLYKSSKGRYYIICESQYQGTPTTAEWLSREAAALWLLNNEHDLPEDLSELRERVEE